MDKNRFTDEQMQQLAMNRTPRGCVWHHGAVPGEMNLVNSHVHRQTGHDTGYCNWPKASGEEKEQELREERQLWEARPREMVGWGFVEPLKNSNLIRKFERQEGIAFPEVYKACAQKCNGAYPSRDGFITEAGTISNIKCLLSFNKDSTDSMWVFPDYFNKTLRNEYVNFAEDSNGNHICFRKKDLAIVWIDHETETIEWIAPDFLTFLYDLY